MAASLTVTLTEFQLGNLHERHFRATLRAEPPGRAGVQGTAPAPQRVIVVGAGNSAAQLGGDLSRAARVMARLHVVAQRPFGWLFCFPDVQPVIAVPGVRTAFRRRIFDVRPMFTAFMPTVAVAGRA